MHIRLRYCKMCTYKLELHPQVGRVRTINRTRLVYRYDQFTDEQSWNCDQLKGMATAWYRKNCPWIIWATDSIFRVINCDNHWCSKSQTPWCSEVQNRDLTLLLILQTLMLIDSHHSIAILGNRPQNIAIPISMIEIMEILKQFLAKSPKDFEFSKIIHCYK